MCRRGPLHPFAGHVIPAQSCLHQPSRCASTPGVVFYMNNWSIHQFSYTDFLSGHRRTRGIVFPLVLQDSIEFWRLSMLLRIKNLTNTEMLLQNHESSTVGAEAPVWTLLSVLIGVNQNCKIENFLRGYVLRWATLYATPPSPFPLAGKVYSPSHQHSSKRALEGPRHK